MIIERDFQGQPNMDLHEIQIGRYLSTFIIDRRVGYKSISDFLDYKTKQLKRFINKKE